MTRLPIELSVDRKACIKENVLYIQAFNAGVTFTRERSKDVYDTYESFYMKYVILQKSQ